LEADTDVVSDPNKRKWENFENGYLKKIHEIPKNEDLPKLIFPEPPQKQQPPPEPEKKQRKKRKQKSESVETSETPMIEIPTRKRGEAWDRDFELYQKGEKSNALNTWIYQNRNQFKTGKLTDERREKLMQINFPFETSRKKDTDTSKRKRGEAWEINYEAYQKGEKSNAISTWIANNRKEYKTGKLTEAKLEKLMAVNFPFEAVARKSPNDAWHKNLEEWKKGERKSKFVQLWKHRSIKKYTEGTLPEDRIMKLKEVGILK
jgi:predicted transglutaminase-like cysteine proteinase